MRTTGNPPRALGRRRPGRRAAEELLDHTGGAGAAGVASGAAAGSSPAGPGFDPGPEFEALNRLLDAAAGPALAAELSGEDAARAVFCANYSAAAQHSVGAHHSVSATPSKERRVFSKALLAKTVTVKIAVAVCGVSVVGVSAAAATNSLPSGLQSKVHSLGFPAPKPAAIHNDSLAGSHQDADSPHPGTPAPTGTSAKPAAAHDDQAALDAAGAKLLGDDGFRLCKAVEDGDRDDHGHDLTAAELQKLAKAADVPAADIARLQSRLDAERSQAQKRMQDFCDRLAQAEKDAREGHVPTFPIPTPHPGDGWPTSWPTQLPTVPGLPTHLPTGLPTHLPTVPPSHLPTSLPTGWPTGWPIDGGPQNPVDPIRPGVPTASGSGGGQH